MTEKKRRSAVVMAIVLLMCTTTGNGVYRLNSVSSQRTRGKSILRETRMDIPKRLSNVVFFIVKCNESEHKISSFIIYLAKIIFKISWVTFV